MFRSKYKNINISPGWRPRRPAWKVHIVLKVSLLGQLSVMRPTALIIRRLTVILWTPAPALRAPAVPWPGTLSRKSGDRKVVETQMSLKSTSQLFVSTVRTSCPVSSQSLPPMDCGRSWNTRMFTGAAPRCVRRGVWPPPDICPPHTSSSQVRTQSAQLSSKYYGKFLFLNVPSDVDFSHII